MQNFSEKSRGFMVRKRSICKYIAGISSVSILLSGCSIKTVNAGYVKETVSETVNGETEKAGDTEFIGENGKETESITISDVKFSHDAEDVMKQHDISHIKTPPDGIKWMSCEIKNSHDGEIPVYTMNEDGTELSKYGIQYDGKCYYIGDDIYCCAVPKEKEKVLIKAGTYTAVAEDRQEEETATEKETQSGSETEK